MHKRISEHSDLCWVVPSPLCRLLNAVADYLIHVNQLLKKRVKPSDYIENPSENPFFYIVGKFYCSVYCAGGYFYTACKEGGSEKLTCLGEKVALLEV